MLSSQDTPGRPKSSASRQQTQRNQGTQSGSPELDAKDAGKADKTKYKTWAATQHCDNCALFQGKAGDASAVCPLFGTKRVAGKGWCSAWAKKA